jgi:signal transduction histidine kinase
MHAMSHRGGLALAAGVLAFAFVTTLVGAASGAPADFLVADLVMGATFIAAGLTAVILRPGSPAGPMLLVSGALWFVGSYSPSRQPVVMHLGFAFERYYDLVLAGLLLILSSPMRRLRPTWLIAALGAAMIVRSLGRLTLADPALLGCGDCPPNPFVLWRSVAAFEAVEITSSLAIAALAIGVGALAVIRLRRMGALWRRVRWAVLVAGGLAMAAAAFDAVGYAWTTATHGPMISLTEPWATLLPWSIFGARTLVPIGFLVATLSTRAASGPIGRLAVGLERGDGDTVGDAVRNALGDQSLVLLRRRSADVWETEDGATVAAPLPLPGQSITLVGPREAPVAALVHDAALAERPELMDGVVRVLHLALDNERLDAELREQLRAVNASRERIVSAAAEERRRLERDLHDGAQQRLVAVTLALQRARATADGERVSDGLRAQLDEAAHETSEAIRELRELARGIHPAILEDAGLEAAVAGLARRVGIPVDVSVSLDGRLPPMIESTAYFTIAEALTNAQRHARASRASVRLVQTGDRLEIEVSDDGRGGADPGQGTGLRGLSDRVMALGGRLEVDSDPAHGTSVRAALPTP